MAKKTIELSNEQALAASPHAGRRAVVASAGAGKTTTLAYRISYLMSHMGVADHDILATSFTKASAKELKERIDSFLGRDSEILSGTIHSYCRTLVSRYFRNLGYSRIPVIISASRSQAIVGSLVEAMDIFRNDINKMPPPNMIEAREWILEEAVRRFSSNTLDRSDKYADKESPVWASPLYEAYVGYLRRYDSTDVDLMMVDAVELLSLNETFRFMDALLPRHIFVDEAQDLSGIQWALVEYLYKYAESLDCIGDDDQSIYLWRSAVPKRFLQYANSADSKVILSSNRRSTPTIVSFSKEFIEHAVAPDRRIYKDLISARPLDSIPDKAKAMMVFSKDYSEIIDRIKMFIDHDEGKYKDIAFIYRSPREILLVLEPLLKLHQIPYRILGGASGFENAWNRFLMTAAQLVSSSKGGGFESTPLWLEAFELTGISPLAADKIFGGSKLTVEGIKEKIKGSRIKDSNKEAALAFASSVETLRSSKEPLTLNDMINVSSIGGIINTIITHKHTKGATSKSSHSTHIKVEETKKDFIAMLDPYLNSPIETYVKDFELGASVKKNAVNNNVVTLTTSHSAKGLEWDMVYVLSAHGDHWPSKSVKETATAAMDEEARLLYVAMTRAKNYLYFVSNYKDFLKCSPFFQKYVQIVMGHIVSYGVKNGEQTLTYEFNNIEEIKSAAIEIMHKETGYKNYMRESVEETKKNFKDKLETYQKESEKTLAMASQSSPDFSLVVEKASAADTHSFETNDLESDDNSVYGINEDNIYADSDIYDI